VNRNEANENSNQASEKSNFPLRTDLRGKFIAALFKFISQRLQPFGQSNKAQRRAQTKTNICIFVESDAAKGFACVSELWNELK
jgi:hypothetical protein